MSPADIERARARRSEVQEARARHAKRIQGAPLEEFTSRRRTSRFSGGKRI